MKKGEKKYVATSPWMHEITAGGTKTLTNPKSVSVEKAEVTLREGSTFRIKAKVNKWNPKKRLLKKTHAPELRYYSSNKKIATVTKSGRIKAKTPGNCKVYVVAVNGVRKTVKVTVQ